MPSAAETAAAVQRHPSPPLGVVAIAFTVVFCAGLYPVTMFGGMPYFPGPWEPAQTIVSFFKLRPTAALLCAFLQFGSAIPLGIFTATVVSRLRFLGVRAAGIHIALFGGFGLALFVAARLPTRLRRDGDVRPLGIDRYGMRLRVESAEGDSDVRLPFRKPVDDIVGLGQAIRVLMGCPFVNGLRARQD